MLCLRLTFGGLWMGRVLVVMVDEQSLLGLEKML